MHPRSTLLPIAAFLLATASRAQCPAGEVEVTIAVTTDDYGYETYWQLVPGGNGCGVGTLFEGGNLTMDCSSGGGQQQVMSGYGNAMTITEGPWCLTDGAAYDLISIDDWGDGQASFEVFGAGGSIATFGAPGAVNVFSFIAHAAVARDMGITALTTPLYADIGDEVPVRGTVKTFGTEPVSTYRLNYSIDNGAPVSQVMNAGLQPGGSAEFQLDVPWMPSATGTFHLDVWADQINGEADQNTANDVRSSTHVISAAIPNVIDQLLASAPVVTQIANADDDLLVPRDLAFHPEHARNELWVINKDTEQSGSSTVKFTHVGEAGQTHLWQEDPNNWHFMSLATGIAFGDNGDFSTSPGVFDANHNGGNPPFTGITLWSSDPAIYAQGMFGPLGSHLDMLHVTPNAQGIAHEVWNAYWAVDGYNHDVVRHDFRADHGPGHDYHGDAVIRRYSGMSITRDPNDHVVSHCVLDHAKHWLYVVDHGGQRVLRLDIHSGTPGGAPSFGPFESYVEYTQMVNDTWEVVATTGLDQPAGIAIIGDRLLVSDYSNGDIVVYDVAAEGTPEIGRIITNSPGIMGIEIGPTGAIWAVNATYHQLLRIEASPSTGIAAAALPAFSVYPVPAKDVLRFAGLRAGAQERMQVYDAMGRMVLESNSATVVANGLDVSGLAPGGYVVRCASAPAQAVRFTVVR